MFGLDSEITLDAAFVGNETRYINHGDERDENVVARGVYTHQGLSQHADWFHLTCSFSSMDQRRT